MGFIIAGVIALLILIIMLLWIRLSLIYDGDGARISVKVLFFKYTVVGKKKKKPKKSDFKIRKFRRRRKKVIAKYRKKLSKTKKKSSQNAVKKSKSKKKSTPKELVSKLIDIFGLFLKRFPKYLRVDCARLMIGVGGKDAAETAISYGVTVQSVQYIAELLDKITNFEAKNNANISVYPDFTSEKWNVDIDVVMRLRVIHIVKLGIIVLKQYIKHKFKGKKTASKRSAAEEKAA